MNCPGQGGSCRAAGTCPGPERGWSSPVPPAWMDGDSQAARLCSLAPARGGAAGRATTSDTSYPITHCRGCSLSYQEYTSKASRDNC